MCTTKLLAQSYWPNCFTDEGCAVRVACMLRRVRTECQQVVPGVSPIVEDKIRCNFFVTSSIYIHAYVLIYWMVCGCRPDAHSNPLKPHVGYGMDLTTNVLSLNPETGQHVEFTGYSVAGDER